MAKPSYYDLLRHPKWQEKRLRIMERDEFKCRHCENSGETLNVHHGYYIKEAKPWEYPDDALICLCEYCHGKAEEQKIELLKRFVLTDLIHAVAIVRAAEYMSLEDQKKYICERAEILRREDEEMVRNRIAGKHNLVLNEASTG